MSLLYSAELENRTSRSAFYLVEVRELGPPMEGGDHYAVDITYGKIGTAGVMKSSRLIGLGGAKDYATSKLRSKLSGDYLPAGPPPWGRSRTSFREELTIDDFPVAGPPQRSAAYPEVRAGDAVYIGSDGNARRAVATVATGPKPEPPPSPVKKKIPRRQMLAQIPQRRRRLDL